MLIQERLIVPGLGVVILLFSFLLGVPLVYQVLLGLLGAAAVGTYFAPPAVQVETRIAIAALGLIILIIAGSVPLLLVLLSFAAIAALQIPHRHTLQRSSSATVVWLNALLSRRRGAPAVTEATDEGEGPPKEQKAPAGGLWLDVGQLPAFVRLNVAGIGASLLGLLVLVSILAMPWVGLLAQGYGELDAASLTLSEADEAFEKDLPHIGTLAVAMLALAAVSIVSIVLPRIMAGLVAAAGLAVNVATYIYIFQGVEDADLGIIGIDVLTLPSAGAIVSAICCLLIVLVQIFPRFNRSRSKEVS